MIQSVDRLRSDARANRDRILDVARCAFATDPNTPLYSIARNAGVGTGTFYRHFANRDELLVEICRQDIEGMSNLVITLLEQHAPWCALEIWCESYVAIGCTKQSIAEAFRAAMSERDLQEIRQSLLNSMTTLIEACEQEGSIRTGVVPDDVLILLSSAFRVSEGEEGRCQMKRIIHLILLGLGAIDCLSYRLGQKISDD